MRALRLIGCLILLRSAGVSQPADTVAFDVASVKISDRQLGPDYNNQLAFSPAGLTAKNLTLRRLVAEAWRLQLRQVIGPNWLDQNEYDIEARAGRSVGREELDVMLRILLAERFDLKQHGETREMRLYELIVGRAGPKIRRMKAGETTTDRAGLHFRGEMRQFADFLAVQLSIPAADDPSQPARAGGPIAPVLIRQALPVPMTSAWISDPNWARTCSPCGKERSRNDWDCDLKAAEAR
jgi:hypothetical protein